MGNLYRRNCNMRSYAIKSHDHKYCITLYIFVNVIETLELKTHSHKYYPSLYKEAVQWTASSADFWSARSGYITYVTCVVGICLICPHSPLSTRTLVLAHTYQANPCYISISGKSMLPMLYIKHVHLYQWIHTTWDIHVTNSCLICYTNMFGV